MKTFHILTLIIAILIFSILLIYSAVKMSQQKSIYPPIITNCPDLWTVDDSGNCEIPSDPALNIGTLTGKPLFLYDQFRDTDMNGYSFLPQVMHGNTAYNGTPQKTSDNKTVMGYFSYDIPYGFDPAKPTKINFNDPLWGSQGDPNCAIKLWAGQKEIQWDGIKSYSC